MCTSCWYCSRWCFGEKGSHAQLRWTDLKLQIEIKLSRYGEDICIRCHTNLEIDLKHLEPTLLQVTGISITEKFFLPVPLQMQEYYRLILIHLLFHAVSEQKSTLFQNYGTVEKFSTDFCLRSSMSSSPQYRWTFSISPSLILWFSASSHPSCDCHNPSSLPPLFPFDTSSFPSMPSA